MTGSDSVGIPSQHDASTSREQRVELAGLKDIRSLGLELSDILNVPALQALINEFYRLVPIPFAVLDLTGNVLVGVGWQDICLKYHREHPETCKYCIESDTELSAGVPDGEMKLYKCKNHMWDIVTPIFVGGEHIGNIFSGQFFFDDEEIDRELFRDQARRYGFPEQAYLAALDRVPHVSRTRLEQGMRFFVQLAQMISQMSYSNIRLRQSLKERDTLMASRRQSEERLRVLGDNLPDSVVYQYTHDSNGTPRFLYISAGVERLNGVKPEAVMNDASALYCQVLPEDLPALLEAERLSARDLSLFEREVQIRLPDGQLRWIHLRSQPRREANGRIVWDGVQTDITARKQHEAELQKLNRTLAALGHSNQSLLHAEDEIDLLRRVCKIIVDDCGYKMAWIGLAEADDRKSVRPVASAGFEHGYLENAAITWADDERGRGPTGTAIRIGRATTCRNMLNDPAFEPWRKEALHRGYASNIVLPLMMPANLPAAASVAGPELDCGKVFGAITIYSVLSNPFSDGEVNLLVELAADLSYGIRMIRTRAAHAKAEQELRKNRAKLDAALASMTDAVFISDAEGRSHQFNDAFATFHRFKTKADCVQIFAENPDILEVFLPSGEPAPLDMWAVPRALRGEVATNAEYTLRRKDTGETWVGSYSFGPIRDKDGKVVGSVVVARDITDRKQAEEALLRSEKLASVGRMAASIAHEINNPLAAVCNVIYLIKMNKDLPEAVREDLDTAEEELQRIEYITRQSLGFYRESNGPALTSLCEVLDSTVELLKSQIRTKGAVIEKQWRGEVKIHAVAGELRQVFANLVTNALDAVDGGGRITLRVSLCSLRGDRIRVTVADNGQGIGASALPHIFEPFFTTKGTFGTGLGLWVSKQIIDKHHGTVRVRSSQAGARRGTVFSVFLPINAVAADPALGSQP